MSHPDFIDTAEVMGHAEHLLDKLLAFGLPGLVAVVLIILALKWKGYLPGRRR